MKLECRADIPFCAGIRLFHASPPLGGSLLRFTSLIVYGITKTQPAGFKCNCTFFRDASVILTAGPVQALFLGLPAAIFTTRHAVFSCHQLMLHPLIARCDLRCLLLFCPEPFFPAHDAHLLKVKSYGKQSNVVG